MGNQCINYGINESRCTDCPLLDDDDLTDEEMEMLVNMGDEYEMEVVEVVEEETSTANSKPPKKTTTESSSSSPGGD